MNIVISQPMYIPWPGIFEQIRLSDVFVHFDDVQIPQGRSFSSRVQLKTPQGFTWLSVPLMRSTRNLIKEVIIDNDKDWINKHLALISQHLKSAPYFSDALALFEKVVSNNFDFLADLNICFIETIAHYLGLNTKFYRASTLSTEGKSSKKLLNILKQLNGKTYITGHGAKNYLDHELFEKEMCSVQYMNYNIAPYKQFHGAFNPYVSTLDLIAHNGKNALKSLNSSLVNWKDFAL